jgi:hypothetical protein
MIEFIAESIDARLNLAITNEHVPEIERRIRVVKERCRANRHSLPFQWLPKPLTIDIVLNAVKLLNEGRNFGHL